MAKTNEYPNSFRLDGDWNDDEAASRFCSDLVPLDDGSVRLDVSGGSHTYYATLSTILTRDQVWELARFLNQTYWRNARSEAEPW